jgi:hypothetical protein
MFFAANFDAGNQIFLITRGIWHGWESVRRALSRSGIGHVLLLLDAGVLLSIDCSKLSIAERLKRKLLDTAEEAQHVVLGSSDTCMHVQDLGNIV